MLYIVYTTACSQSSSIMLIVLSFLELLFLIHQFIFHLVYKYALYSLGSKTKEVKFRDKSNGRVPWPREGFPETLQYEMELEGHGMVELDLQWNRFLSMPGDKGSNARRNVKFFSSFLYLVCPESP